ncbi:hypothetical protein NMG60_11003726 [Bertholletia excelsa]
MDWGAIWWVVFFLMNMCLIAFNLYQIVCLTDLEADYLNPYESSSKINTVVVPEFVLHGVFCALFLLTGHWFMFLLTLPVACYNAMLFVKGRHLIDVTEVFRHLNAEKKYRIIKLVFYMLLLILVIVRYGNVFLFFICILFKDKREEGSLDETKHNLIKNCDLLLALVDGKGLIFLVNLWKKCNCSIDNVCN